jgi:hypothetical protein
MAVQLIQLNDVPSQTPDLEVYLTMAEDCRDGPNVTYDRQYLEDSATACLAEAAHLSLIKLLSREQREQMFQYLEAAETLYETAGLDQDTYFPANLQARLEMMRAERGIGQELGLGELVAVYGTDEQHGQYH